MFKKLWVGQTDERSLVFDPDVQLPECPHLFLWDPETKQMRKYVSELARTHIRPHEDAQIAVAHIASYKLWKANYIDTWLNDERQFYETRRVNQENLEAERRTRELAEEEARLWAGLSPEERHKRRLEKLGKNYLGVRVATRERGHRVTYCYACKRDLDNAIDVECIACGWILCSCGACGCGYSA